MPERIQRQRTKGWRLADRSTNAVYVGRGSKWGNPYRVGESYPEADGRVIDAARAVELFELHTGPMGNHELDEDEVRRELGGKDLVCWCPLFDEHGNRPPCHADVLLSIANPGASDA